MIYLCSAMKYIFIILALVLMISGCGILRPLKGTSTDLDEGRLKSAVKAIYETDREVSEASGEWEYTRHTILHYNEEGYIVSEEVFRAPGGKGVSRSEYSYDETGRMLEESISYDLAARTYMKYLYEYNPGGRLEKQSSAGARRL